MKRIAIAAAAAWLGLGTAGAQAFDWSGFYAGVQGGLFNGTGWIEEYEELIGIWPIVGPFGGVFAGFNAQHNSIVFGVEADFNVASASGETQGMAEADFYEYGSSVDSFGSIRKRIGVTAGNWLFFGTAGIAFANGEFWSSYCDGECALPEYQDVTHFGFVVGAGAEYALSDTVSIRKDLRFYNFGSQTVQLGETAEEEVEYYLTAVTASVGISWHF
ncbi:MAG: outer membrane beta-barrel protein [Cucumibacter sp.]